MLKRILEELQNTLNESWLSEKHKYMELEPGFYKKTNRIEIRWLHNIVIADDEYNCPILDEDGKPIVEEIYEYRYIDLFGYCWSSAFEGSISQNNEMIDDDGYIFPIYNLPVDLKNIAESIMAYLIQGIENSRHEQVDAVLQDLKKNLINPDEEEGDLKKIKIKFYNQIRQQLREKHPFFFDELTSVREKKSLRPKLMLWHCDQICRFTINKTPFISRKEGPEHLTQGKLLYLILTTPFKSYSQINARLMSQDWSKGDVYYLIYQLIENFSGIESMVNLEKGNKLLFGIGDGFKDRSFRKFKSQDLVGYEVKNKTNAEEIHQQLAQILQM